MPRPQPNAKLRVLVCDDGLLLDYYRKDSAASSSPQYFTTQYVGAALGGKAEITRVDNLAAVVKEISSRRLPYYALVVYAAHQITNQSGGMLIQKVRNMDPYLPQLIFGRELDAEIEEKAMRRGVRYYAVDVDALRKRTDAIFWHPHEPLRNLDVVKFGGSAWEYTEQYPDSQNLRYSIEEIKSIKKREVNERDPQGIKLPKKQIIGAVGAGNVGEGLKGDLDRSPDIQEAFPQLMAKGLELNLMRTYAHFGSKSAHLLQSEDFYFIEPDFATKIILMAIAPHYLLARDQIPLQDSDTHTIAIAEFYGAKRVILIKRTDAIYDFDPYRGGFTNDLQKWITAQDGNKPHAVLDVDELLSKRVLREGTKQDGKPDGRDGHLMEDSGLEYFSHCKTVEEILVVHIAPEEMYFPIGGNRFQHVVTHEQLVVDPQTGWKGILEQRIRDAFQGIALSKIVRQ